MWKHKQIEPQPARGKLVESMWDDPQWIAEEKYDGDRRIAQFCGGRVRFTGRRKSVKDGLFVEKTDNVPHLSASGWDPRMAGIIVPSRGYGVPASLDGTVLDGEMIFNGTVEGGASKLVTSIMGSLPDEAIAKQIERGWLRYVVFDCLYWKGESIMDRPLEERIKYAACAVRTWDNPYVACTAGNVPKMRSKREMYDYIVKNGGEGVVLKRLDHKYGDKTGWVKVKKESTADVVIMGFIDAKKVSKKTSGEVSMTKYAKAGLIGAIQCGQYIPRARVSQAGEVVGVVRVEAPPLTEVATVSGMDDALRTDLTRLGKAFIGKVIEIKHNGREPTGRFRHPRFSRFREDKDPRTCIYDPEES
jgi:ATP-dependent DNA ligase